MDMGTLISMTSRMSRLLAAIAALALGVLAARRMTGDPDIPVPEGSWEPTDDDRA